MCMGVYACTYACMLHAVFHFVCGVSMYMYMVPHMLTPALALSLTSHYRSCLSSTCKINTGLSDAELCEVLLALTAEHHSLLLQTFTQTSSSSMESKASSLLEEEGSLQGTPFRASSSFRLNDNLSRDLTRHHSAALVRFQDIWLVSRGAVPNHGERAVGLAHLCLSIAGPSWIPPLSAFLRGRR